jgi:hypothetical protein
VGTADPATREHNERRKSIVFTSSQESNQCRLPLTKKLPLPPSHDYAAHGGGDLPRIASDRAQRRSSTPKRPTRTAPCFASNLKRPSPPTRLAETLPSRAAYSELVTFPSITLRLIWSNGPTSGVASCTGWPAAPPRPAAALLTPTAGQSVSYCAPMASPISTCNTRAGSANVVPTIRPSTLTWPRMFGTTLTCE